MAITKLGKEMLKELKKEAFVDPIIGAVRAGNLNDAERKALIKHYGLDNDANLVLRNAGRGILGGSTGSMVGAIAGGILGAKLGKPMAGSTLGAISGWGLGLKGMTDKYSKARAQELLKKRDY